MTGPRPDRPAIDPDLLDALKLRAEDFNIICSCGHINIRMAGEPTTVRGRSDGCPAHNPELLADLLAYMSRTHGDTRAERRKHAP